MKRYAPATGRNSVAIAGVLQQELPNSGTVLEIASGSGEHAVFMARRFPQLIWQPTDRDEDAIASIREWAQESGLTNMAEPAILNASEQTWPVQNAGAIFCCNMVHISPWSATRGLFTGAAQILSSNAPLILYGPFIDPSVDTAPSNIAFGRTLKERNPRWGLRSLTDMDELSDKYGFRLMAQHQMPANNLTLIYRKL